MSVKIEELIKVALRYNAIYFTPQVMERRKNSVSRHSLAISAKLREYGYSVGEEALHAINAMNPNELAVLADTMDEVLMTQVNWASLVKGWLTPTGEDRLDHLITLIANGGLSSEDGEQRALLMEVYDLIETFNATKLPCGHIIPDGTFDLERYNGCPFCGKPFTTANYVHKGQGSRLRQLDAWSDDTMLALQRSLLESPTPLDATQVESLKTLILAYGMPDDAKIVIKENIIIVTSLLLDVAPEKVAPLTDPVDIMRLLWYRHTGHLRIIEPRTLVDLATKSGRHYWQAEDRSDPLADAMRTKLKLHFGRKECRVIARWLNDLPMSAERACELMHPKRGMWVRFIRALRLAEYARKEGFGNLAKLMDCFYNSRYSVLRGEMEKARLNEDADTYFALAKRQPGMFARSLFSDMLWFEPERTLAEFETVLYQLPPRLVVTLGMYAENYFDRNCSRSVKTISGYTVTVEANRMLSLYTEEECREMSASVQKLYLSFMRKKFEDGKTETEKGERKIFIAPELYNIPVSIGDRSTTIQDTSCALQGMVFPVEGDKVRLFMHWGVGLPAQHMDMDLSCYIAFDDMCEVCSYYNLVATGAKHSGDIRYIPDNVGTAEYIELDLTKLTKAGARFVSFTCNAYSIGSLQLNMVVGWMNSAKPMKVSEYDGVAYDPSTVQHRVRISEQNLSKGLVFGVLDVTKREIVWLEVPFDGQTVGSMDNNDVMNYLAKLAAKAKVGEILDIKAEVQNLVKVDNAADADEAYTLQWALDSSAVAAVLFGN